MWEEKGWCEGRGQGQWKNVKGGQVGGWWGAVTTTLDGWNSENICVDLLVCSSGRPRFVSRL